MPLGRHKTPFSGKAKKQQLKESRARKAASTNVKGGSRNHLLVAADDDSSSDKEDGKVLSVNQQPSKFGKSNINRYNLQFHRETNEEIKQRREEARKSLEPVDEACLEVNSDDYFPPELDFPTRPPWDYGLSKEQLDARENKYFTEYLKNIEQKFSWSELSYFELNLETWRQLWRVLEMSDIVLLITDIRFPALMLPPSLYKYVTETLEKELIVVLNKIDLAPSPLVVAWKHHLQTKYPGIHIVMFTSFPTYNLRSNSSTKTGGLQVKKRRGKMRMAAEGAQKLLDACKNIVQDKVDLSSWQEKIKEEMLIEYDVGEEEVEVSETINLKSQDTSYYRHQKYENGVLTIGCVGQPNVGKSSLMNGLMGKKVVSVSRTPGHTKHFQTIFLTRTVKLCDCPGLVFPSKVPKPIQVLMGSFPIAQLRDPYTTVKFLAERMDLVSLLKIEHPEQDTEWSAIDVCDGWAKKKGFYTAKAARLDTYRAANHLLRMALDGKVPFCMWPPRYSKEKEKWKGDPEVNMVQWIQASGEEEQTRPKAGPVGAASEEDSEGEGEESEEETGARSNRLSVSVPSDESDGQPQASNKFLALNSDTDE